MHTRGDACPTASRNTPAHNPDPTSPRACRFPPGAGTGVFFSRAPVCYHACLRSVQAGAGGRGTRGCTLRSPRRRYSPPASTHPHTHVHVTTRRAGPGRAGRGNTLVASYHGRATCSSSMLTWQEIRERLPWGRAGCWKAPDRRYGLRDGEGWIRRDRSARAKRGGIDKANAPRAPNALGKMGVLRTYKYMHTDMYRGTTDESSVCDP
jgi:hypothetical protein